MNDILIIPVGRPRKGHLKRLSVSLAAELDTNVQRLNDRLDPHAAEIPDRGQFNSTTLLSRLVDEYADGDHTLLGVTQLDLAIPILTYVFGEAQVDGHAAIISTMRLDPRFYGLPKDDALFEKRILMEALHELGHTRGLHHCTDWHCVMHSATDVDEIDVRGQFYCSDCKREILT